MEDDKYNVPDLVINAIEKKPVEFETTFNNIIVDRISSAIEDRKMELAQTMFNDPADFSEE
jgi:hypothetical protein